VQDVRSFLRKCTQLGHEKVFARCVVLPEQQQRKRGIVTHHVHWSSKLDTYNLETIYP